jgi:phospholipase/carboxylesterase
MMMAAEQGRLVARPRPGAGSGESAPAGVRSLGLGSDRDGLVYVPSRYRSDRPLPLLVMLHGAGGDADQVLPMVTSAADADGVLIVAPASRGRTWDVILDGYGADVRFIDRALAHIFDRHAVDPHRIAIGGFSDGASYALSLGLANGDLFTQVLAFSPGFMAPAAWTGSPRLYMAHGVRDDVLPIERTSRYLAPELRRLGYEVEYREFEGGHMVPPDIVHEATSRVSGD